MEIPLTDEDAEKIAHHVVDRLVDRMSDDATVEKIVGVWGKSFDLILGRGMRKLIWLAALGLIALATFKIDAIIGAFKP